MSAAPRVLSDTRGRLGRYAAPLIAQAPELLARAGQIVGLARGHELSLVLCDNPTIQRVNRDWRRIDRPTDVLSFPLHELKPGTVPPDGPIGDIMIALPTVRLAAGQLGIGLEAHLAHLLVHGLLHLLGHDHETDAQARRMEREERRLLRALGQGCDAS